MTKLSCSATTCLYNQDRYCCKGDIKVEGQSAKKMQDTCCGSFKEREDSMTNSMGHACREIDVACEACSCVHNDNRKCSADQIGITGPNACKCTDTECHTFECRCGCRGI